MLGDVVHADAHRLRLLAVDRHHQLRIVDGERREESRQPRRLIALPEHLLHGAGEIVDRAAGEIERLELEAAEVAEALHRGRQERHDNRAGDPP